MQRKVQRSGRTERDCPPLSVLQCQLLPVCSRCPLVCRGSWGSEQLRIGAAVPSLKGSAAWPVGFLDPGATVPLETGEQGFRLLWPDLSLPAVFLNMSPWPVLRVSLSRDWLVQCMDTVACSAPSPRWPVDPKTPRPSPDSHGQSWVLFPLWLLPLVCWKLTLSSCHSERQISPFSLGAWKPLGGI